MPCTPVPMPGGGVAIVCTKKERKVPCVVCGEPSTRLCDHMPPGRKRSCAAALCDRHTKRDGEHDLCPTHALPPEIPKPITPPAPKRRAGPRPVQLELFGEGRT